MLLRYFTKKLKCQPCGDIKRKNMTPPKAESFVLCTKDPVAISEITSNYN